jgi:hypothetical protein
VSRLNPSQKRTLGYVAVAIIAFAPRSAFGQGRPTARLTYVRDDACPTEARFVESVAERLGYAPFVPQAGRALVVSLDKAGARWVGRVTLTDAEGRVSGQRAIDSATSCDDLAATAAFVVTVLLEPGGPPPPPPAPPPPPPVVLEPPNLPEEAPPEAPAPPPPPDETAPLGISAGLEAVVGAGLAPVASLGGAVFGSLRRGVFLLSVEARSDLPASSDDAATSARIWLAQGSVVPCLARGPFAACVIVSAGAVWGEGRGTLATSRVGSAPYVAGGGRLECTLPINERLFVRAHADLVAPLTRPSFAIGGERVYELSVLAAAGGLGFGLRFR